MMMKTVQTKKLIVILLVVWSLVSTPAIANYQQAQAFMGRGDYVSSASAFFQAYGFPKARGERQKAEWGLAQSLQRLQFWYSASKYYSVIVRRGPRANNPFFRGALEELGKIDYTVNLGQSHIVQLFRTKIDPAAVPNAARGFYFYYLGVEAFSKRRFEVADDYFRRVPPRSPYFSKALFHLGVVSNLRGRSSRAISYFERVVASAPRGPSGAWLREQANLNIARVFYETKQYRSSLRYYGQIPRESDNWLQALFEASWAFFLMQKHNNVLGTIHTLHSPFFENRFFPESYILEAITFLRLCRFKEVKSSLGEFKERYKPVFQDLRAMLGKSDSRPNEFFKLVYSYDRGTMNNFRKAWAILDSLSRTDIYKEAGNTIRFSDNELARLSRYRGRWAQSGLADELSSFLRKKKVAAISDSGRRLINKATGYYAYLKELSDQTQLINTEMVLNRVDEFRKKLNLQGAADNKGNFIGGLQPLKVGEDLEYWPFEGEYWEDELGGYVYNINSECQAPKKGDK